MIEKVNPKHPDKIADRIAGAIVDLGYKLQENPKIAVEVLIGHSRCFIIYETSLELPQNEIHNIVWRIVGNEEIKITTIVVPQDKHLSDNQKGKIRCGDNGIFKGMPLTAEDSQISYLAHQIYNKYKTLREKQEKQ